jgi:anti-sigma B factor antagonist
VAPDQGSFGSVRTGELALERTESGLAVVTISGEHDLSTAPELRRRLDSLLDEGAPTVVDLSPATFIDSSILGVILDCRRRAADADLGYAVVHSNGADAVDRVLEVTGLKAELPVHARREDAASAITEVSGEPSP